MLAGKQGAIVSPKFHKDTQKVTKVPELHRNPDCLLLENTVKKRVIN